MTGSVFVLPAVILAGLMACSYANGRDAKAAIMTLQETSPASQVPAGPPQLHVIGDSFTASEEFQRALEQELPDHVITFDGVGTTSLADQVERLAGTPDRWNVPLLIVDGGLTDARPLEQVERMVSMLDTACPVWFYVEPVQRAVPGNLRGQPRFERQRRNVEAIQARHPGHFIPAIAPLQRHAASNEQRDVDRGWIPASLRADRIHLNDVGNEILAAEIAAHIREAERNQFCPPPELEPEPAEPR